MQYSQIFKRAFNVVRNEPALWIVGVIIAIFGGGGGGTSFNSTGNTNFNNNDFGRVFTEGIPLDQFQTDFSSWLNPEILLPIGLFILCLIIGWSFFAFAIRNVALAGLIYGSDRASVGQDVRWGELLRFGWSRHALRLMGLNFLLALPALLFFSAGLIIGIVMIIPFFEALFSGYPPDFSHFENFGNLSLLFGGFGLFICLSLIIGFLTWVLSLIGHYASRFIVLDGYSIMDGFRKGWQLLKDNIGHTFIVSILLIALSFIVGIVVSVVFIMLAALAAIPLVFLIVSESASFVFVGILAVMAFILVIILASLLYGPLLAYIHTVWTLVWLELTKNNGDEVLLDEAMI